MRHIRGQSERGGRIALGVAATGFLVTLACGVASLPARVNIYFTPTERPDAVYERWQYLLLAAVGAVIVAVGFGMLASVVGDLIGEARRGRPVYVFVAAWVAAWTLLWASTAVWLAIWLGNSNPGQRSWLEFLLDLAGLLGLAVTLVWRAIVATPRSGA